MGSTVHLALVFHVFIAVAVMVCGRRCVVLPQLFIPLVAYCCLHFSKINADDDDGDEVPRWLNVFCRSDESFRPRQSSALHRPSNGDWSGYWSRDIALVRGPSISFRRVSRFCDDVYECRADNGASSGPVSHHVRLSVECEFISRPFPLVLLTTLLLFTKKWLGLTVLYSTVVLVVVISVIASTVV